MNRISSRIVSLLAFLSLCTIISVDSKLTWKCQLFDTSTEQLSPRTTFMTYLAEPKVSIKGARTSRSTKCRPRPKNGQILNDEPSIVDPSDKTKTVKEVEVKKPGTIEDIEPDNIQYKRKPEKKNSDLNVGPGFEDSNDLNKGLPNDGPKIFRPTKLINPDEINHIKTEELDENVMPDIEFDLGEDQVKEEDLPWCAEEGEDEENDCENVVGIETFTDIQLIEFNKKCGEKVTGSQKSLIEKRLKIIEGADVVAPAPTTEVTKVLADDGPPTKTPIRCGLGNAANMTDLEKIKCEVDVSVDFREVETCEDLMRDNFEMSDEKRVELIDSCNITSETFGCSNRTLELQTSGQREVYRLICNHDENDCILEAGEDDVEKITYYLLRCIDCLNSSNNDQLIEKCGNQTRNFNCEILLSHNLTNTQRSNILKRCGSSSINCSTSEKAILTGDELREYIEKCEIKATGITLLETTTQLIMENTTTPIYSRTVVMPKSSKPNITCDMTEEQISRLSEEEQKSLFEMCTTSDTEIKCNKEGKVFSSDEEYEKYKKQCPCEEVYKDLDSKQKTTFIRKCIVNIDHPKKINDTIGVRKSSRCGKRMNLIDKMTDAEYEKFQEECAFAEDICDLEIEMLNEHEIERYNRECKPEQSRSNITTTTPRTPSDDIITVNTTINEIERKTVDCDVDVELLSDDDKRRQYRELCLGETTSTTTPPRIPSDYDRITINTTINEIEKKKVNCDVDVELLSDDDKVRYNKECNRIRPISDTTTKSPEINSSEEDFCGSVNLEDLDGIERRQYRERCLNVTTSTTTTPRTPSDDRITVNTTITEKVVEYCESMNDKNLNGTELEIYKSKCIPTTSLDDNLISVNSTIEKIEKEKKVDCDSDVELLSEDEKKKYDRVCNHRLSISDTTTKSPEIESSEEDFCGSVNLEGLDESELRRYKQICLTDTTEKVIEYCELMKNNNLTRRELEIYEQKCKPATPIDNQTISVNTTITEIEKKTVACDSDVELLSVDEKKKYDRVCNHRLSISDTTTKSPEINSSEEDFCKSVKLEDLDETELRRYKRLCLPKEEAPEEQITLNETITILEKEKKICDQIFELLSDFEKEQYNRECEQNDENLPKTTAETPICDKDVEMLSEDEKSKYDRVCKQPISESTTPLPEIDRSEKDFCATVNLEELDESEIRRYRRLCLVETPEKVVEFCELMKHRNLTGQELEVYKQKCRPKTPSDYERITVNTTINEIEKKKVNCDVDVELLSDDDKVRYNKECNRIRPISDTTTKSPEINSSEEDFCGSVNLEDLDGIERRQYRERCLNVTTSTTTTPRTPSDYKITVNTTITKVVEYCESMNDKNLTGTELEIYKSKCIPTTSLDDNLISVNSTIEKIEKEKKVDCDSDVELLSEDEKKKYDRVCNHRLSISDTTTKSPEIDSSEEDFCGSVNLEDLDGIERRQYRVRCLNVTTSATTTPMTPSDYRITVNTIINEIEKKKVNCDVDVELLSDDDKVRYNKECNRKEPLSETTTSSPATESSEDNFCKSVNLEDLDETEIRRYEKRCLAKTTEKVLEFCEAMKDVNLTGKELEFYEKRCKKNLPEQVTKTENLTIPDGTTEIIRKVIVSEDTDLEPSEPSVKKFSCDMLKEIPAGLRSIYRKHCTPEKNDLASVNCDIENPDLLTEELRLEYNTKCIDRSKNITERINVKPEEKTRFRCFDVDIDSMDAVEYDEYKRSCLRLGYDCENKNRRLMTDKEYLKYEEICVRMRDRMVKINSTSVHKSECFYRNVEDMTDEEYRIYEEKCVLKVIPTTTTTTPAPTTTRNPNEPVDCSNVNIRGITLPEFERIMKMCTVEATKKPTRIALKCDDVDAKSLPDDQYELYIRECIETVPTIINVTQNVEVKRRKPSRIALRCDEIDENELNDFQYQIFIRECERPHTKKLKIDTTVKTVIGRTAKLESDETDNDDDEEVEDDNGGIKIITTQKIRIVDEEDELEEPEQDYIESGRIIVKSSKRTLPERVTPGEWDTEEESGRVNVRQSLLKKILYEDDDDGESEEFVETGKRRTIRPTEIVSLVSVSNNGRRVIGTTQIDLGEETRDDVNIRRMIKNDGKQLKSVKVVHKRRRLSRYEDEEETDNGNEWDVLKRIEKRRKRIRKLKSTTTTTTTTAEPEYYYDEMDVPHEITIIKVKPSRRTLRRRIKEPLELEEEEELQEMRPKTKFQYGGYVKVGDHIRVLPTQPTNDDSSDESEFKETRRKILTPQEYEDLSRVRVRTKDLKLRKTEFIPVVDEGGDREVTNVKISKRTKIEKNQDRTEYGDNVEEEDGSVVVKANKKKIKKPKEISEDEEIERLIGKVTVKNKKSKKLRVHHRPEELTNISEENDEDGKRPNNSKRKEKVIIFNEDEKKPYEVLEQENSDGTIDENNLKIVEKEIVKRWRINPNGTRTLIEKHVKKNVTSEKDYDVPKYKTKPDESEKIIEDETLNLNETIINEGNPNGTKQMPIDDTKKEEDQDDDSKNSDSAYGYADETIVKNKSKRIPTGTKQLPHDGTNEDIDMVEKTMVEKYRIKPDGSKVLIDENSSSVDNDENEVNGEIIKLRYRINPDGTRTLINRQDEKRGSVIDELSKNDTIPENREKEVIDDLSKNANDTTLPNREKEVSKVLKNEKFIIQPDGSRVLVNDENQDEVSENQDEDSDLVEKTMVEKYKINPDGSKVLINETSSTEDDDENELNGEIIKLRYRINPDGTRTLINQQEGEDGSIIDDVNKNANDTALLNREKEVKKVLRKQKFIIKPDGSRVLVNDENQDGKNEDSDLVEKTVVEKYKINPDGSKVLIDEVSSSQDDDENEMNGDIIKLRYRINPDGTRTLINGQEGEDGSVTDDGNKNINDTIPQSREKEVKKILRKQKFIIQPDGSRVLVNDENEVKQKLNETIINEGNPNGTKQMPVDDTKKEKDQDGDSKNSDNAYGYADETIVKNKSKRIPTGTKQLPNDGTNEDSDMVEKTMGEKYRIKPDGSRVLINETSSTEDDDENELNGEIIKLRYRINPDGTRTLINRQDEKRGSVIENKNATIPQNREKEVIDDLKKNANDSTLPNREKEVSKVLRKHKFIIQPDGSRVLVNDENQDEVSENQDEDSDLVEKTMVEQYKINPDGSKVLINETSSTEDDDENELNGEIIKLRYRINPDGTRTLINGKEEEDGSVIDDVNRNGTIPENREKEVLRKQKFIIPDGSRVLIDDENEVKQKLNETILNEGNPDGTKQMPVDDTKKDEDQDDDLKNSDNAYGYADETIVKNKSKRIPAGTKQLPNDGTDEDSDMVEKTMVEKYRIKPDGSRVLINETSSTEDDDENELNGEIIKLRYRINPDGTRTLINQQEGEDGSIIDDVNKNANDTALPNREKEVKKVLRKQKFIIKPDGSRVLVNDENQDGTNEDSDMVEKTMVEKYKIKPDGTRVLIDENSSSEDDDEINGDIIKLRYRINPDGTRTLINRQEEKHDSVTNDVNKNINGTIPQSREQEVKKIVRKQKFIIKPDGSRVLVNDENQDEVSETRDKTSHLKKKKIIIKPGGSRVLIDDNDVSDEDDGEELSIHKTKVMYKINTDGTRQLIDNSSNVDDEDDDETYAETVKEMYTVNPDGTRTLINQGEDGLSESNSTINAAEALDDSTDVEEDVDERNRRITKRMYKINPDGTRTLINQTSNIDNSVNGTSGKITKKRFRIKPDGTRILIREHENVETDDSGQFVNGTNGIIFDDAEDSDGVETLNKTFKIRPDGSRVLIDKSTDAEEDEDEIKKRITKKIYKINPDGTRTLVNRTSNVDGNGGDGFNGQHLKRRFRVHPDGTRVLIKENKDVETDENVNRIDETSSDNEDGTVEDNDEKTKRITKRIYKINADGTRTVVNQTENGNGFDGKKIKRRFRVKPDGTRENISENYEVEDVNESAGEALISDPLGNPEKMVKDAPEFKHQRKTKTKKFYKFGKNKEKILYRTVETEKDDDSMPHETKGPVIVRTYDIDEKGNRTLVSEERDGKLVEGKKTEMNLGKLLGGRKNDKSDHKRRIRRRLGENGHGILAGAGAPPRAWKNDVKVPLSNKESDKDIPHMNGKIDN